ncbi:hypothetical protein LINGRAHAP2_LOCUS31657, partial [Linum grandiflorum]
LFTLFPRILFFINHFSFCSSFLSAATTTSNCQYPTVALMLEFIGIEGLKYWCSRDLEVAGFIVSFLYKDSCRFIRIVFYYYYTF